jgi:DNA anti-recombination protein RmuC
MAPETIVSRVDRLERRMTDLETLPDRVTAVESQIVQLRAEMRGEFSAVREEIGAGDEETRRVLGQRIDDTTRVLGERIDETTRVLGERIDENGRHMRVLHEEVIGRLAIIQEGQSPRRRRRDG